MTTRGSWNDYFMTIANEVASEIDKQYKATLERAQTRAKNMGLPDPTIVVPSTFDPDLVPSLVGGGGRTPAPHDIEMLKADHSPKRMKQFDDIYGKGAAARVLGH